MSKKNQLSRELLAAFLEESTEILTRMEDAIIAIEHAEHEEQHSKLLLIRGDLHTLKGAATAVGFTEIKNISHALEDFLDKVSEQPKITSKVFDVFHQAFDFISKSCKSEEKLSSKELIDTLSQMSFEPEEASSQPQQVQQKTSSQPQQAQQKTSSQPQQAQQNPKKTISPKGPQKKAEEEEIVQEQSIRVHISKLNRLHASIGDVVVLQLQQENMFSQIKKLRYNLGTMIQDWKFLCSQLYDCRKQLGDKQWQHMENAHARFSLKIKGAYRELYQLANRSTSHIGQLNLVTSELEEGLKDVRMLPIAPYFKSFARIVREASRDLGKKVRLVVADSNIEMDRRVLDQLRDPLIHLLQNAIAHGIEYPEVRIANGKEEVGTVSLEVDFQGDRAIIRVVDDGSGIDYDNIRFRAIELGLLKADEELLEELLLQILAHPGFSTSKNVTNVSGRGMGMDIVFNIVQNLGGKILLQSMEGFGTCFFLEVPTSLTTSQGLVLKVGPYQLGLPLEMVKRIVRINSTVIEQKEGAEFIYVENKPVAICSLASLLGCTEHAPNQQVYPVPIVYNGRSLLAITIDDILGEIPMVIKPLGPQFAKVPYFCGGTIQSNGSVLPVLNVNQLIQNAKKFQRKHFSAPQTKNKQNIEVDRAQKKVLVVDDSITTRTLERNILEASGYEVFIATNGKEAFSILQAQVDIDLVVTDLQMPHMDGLELCRTIRSSDFSDIPIIMVTSIGAEEEIQKALEAGADRYIIKGDFSQEHFLSAIYSLCPR